MGLIRTALESMNLVKPANPSETWLRDPTQPLRVDLDTHRLCDVGLGDPCERLALLGPGRHVWRQPPDDLMLEWPGTGIRVDITAGLIEAIMLSFGEALAAASGEFDGEFSYRGATFRLSNRQTEAEVRQLLGEPYWRDKDDDEVILFYEFATCEWQVEFDDAGRLVFLSIGPAMMADEKVREDYGVTQPWPPETGCSKHE